METVLSMQSQKEWDSIVRVLGKAELSSIDPTTLHHINSIVLLFEEQEQQQQQPSSRNETKGMAQQQQSQQDYILAILSQGDRVDLSKLQDAVLAATTTTTTRMGSFQNCKLSLAPTDQLSKLCGFEAGCIPPFLGLLTPSAPVMTFLDEALLELPEKVDFVIGGGGAPNQSTVLSLQTLLDSIPNIYTSRFRLETTSSNMATTPAISSTTIPPTRMPMVATTREEKQSVFRPFFCVEPPDTKLALEILKGSTTTTSAKNNLTPESFSIVGRVSGVRQVARRLVFADFAPPLLDHQHNCNGDNDQQQDWHPWRNPRNRDEDMAVQLVLGKTIMERLGEEAGEAALRRLKRGQLILVKGTTNVDRTDSLINWTSKRSLDVRVSEYQILQTANDGGD
eukprot:scaffold6248_cov87-Cylindrotheca_fusiformis.AAC.1